MLPRKTLFLLYMKNIQGIWCNKSYMFLTVFYEINAAKWRIYELSCKNEKLSRILSKIFTLIIFSKVPSGAFIWNIFIIGVLLQVPYKYIMNRNLDHFWGLMGCGIPLLTNFVIQIVVSLFVNIKYRNRYFYCWATKTTKLNDQ